MICQVLGSLMLYLAVNKDSQPIISAIQLSLFFLNWLTLQQTKFNFYRDYTFKHSYSEITLSDPTTHNWTN
jgi:hypothetical protein